MAQETKTIVCCAFDASTLDALAHAVRAVGAWSIVPLAWPSSQAIVPGDAYLLHTGEAGRAPDELAQWMLGRPEGAPLVVIGADPVRRARPNMWLPRVPRSSLLAPMLSHYVDGAVELPRAQTANFTFRRKSDMIIGNSPAVRRLLHSLDQLAPAQTPVIITGESGVGKELVAQALHYCGPRAKAPFIAINCAAIPENLFEAELFGYQRGAFTGAVNAHTGAFEAANKGTLFLDEIGEMPIGMQAKLLRVLETSEVQRIGSTDRKKVNFRLVSATNRNLQREVKEGRFREDLYYRIQVYPLHVVPLRERIEDIPALATHHLSVIAARENRPALRLTNAALEKLVAYPWPGNVRELVNLLERAALMAGASAIDAEHIAFTSMGSTGQHTALGPSLVPYKDAKVKFELEYYTQLMRVCGGNVSLAAKLGQKTRKEIYDALKKLNLDAGEYREEA